MLREITRDRVTIAIAILDDAVAAPAMGRERAAAQPAGPRATSRPISQSDRDHRDEGHNLSIDVRWPRGTFEQDPAVAAELAKANVGVIVAWGTPAVIAARRATPAIPIIMVSVGDPVGSGFIASLAHPGGNITGFSNITVDLSAKLVELLVELVPDIRRVGVVSNIYNPNVGLQLRQTEEAVRKLGLQSLIIEAQTPEEYELRGWPAALPRAYRRIQKRPTPGTST